MEALTSSPIFSSASFFAPKYSSPNNNNNNNNNNNRLRGFPISSKNDANGSDIRSDSNDFSIVPILGGPTLSKDDAMGIVLSAANVRGWTTGSGMEGPPVPAGPKSEERVSTFPWSLFTKSPRRRMRVAFTCNVCGQRTTRAINPHAYTDGTVFVQCCGCNVFHKLVDNLNLFHEMKCYVNPSFNYRDPKGDVSFNYLHMDDDDDDHEDADDGSVDDMFPLF